MADVPETADYAPDLGEIYRRVVSRVKGGQALGASVRQAKEAIHQVLDEWIGDRDDTWRMRRTPVYLVPGQASYTVPADTVDVLLATLTVDGSDRPLEFIGLSDYEALPDKAQAGTPTSLLVQVGREGATVFPWPRADRPMTLTLTRMVRFRDLGTPEQGLDVPRHLVNALVAGGAYFLSLNAEFGIAQADRDSLLREYQRALGVARGYLQDHANLSIRPDLSCYSRAL